MRETLVRGKYLIGGVDASGAADIVANGALLQRDGVVVERGTYDDLRRRHPHCEQLGSAEDIVFPGLINSHHHGGLLAFQMGTADAPLERWTVDRMRRRHVDPYLDTLYGAFGMVASGVTTVQHLHSRANGPLARVEASANEILRAYADLGMRVSYSFGIRDQNRLVYGDDDAFLATVPEAMRGEVRRHVLDKALPLEDQFALFENLHARHASSPLVGIQLSASNLQWCSDEALHLLRDHSARYKAPIHMHLLETFVQRNYAHHRCGMSAVRHLDKLGLLGPALTLGHMVWADQGDMELVAATGTHICHNPSSNLRLRSGVANVPDFLGLGIGVSLGMDDASINDDRDMLTELRVALRLHARPAWDAPSLSESQVFRMATSSGAATTPFGAHIGSLAVGNAADLVVMDWTHIARPHLDSRTPPLDALVHLGRASGIRTVMIGGEQVYKNGVFTRVDQAQAMEALSLQLQQPPSAEEVQRDGLATRLAPHVQRFYDTNEHFGPVPRLSPVCSCRPGFAA